MKNETHGNIHTVIMFRPVSVSPYVRSSNQTHLARVPPYASAGTADPQSGILSVAEQGCFRRPEHGGDDRVQTCVRAPFAWSSPRPESTLCAVPPQVLVELPGAQLPARRGLLRSRAAAHCSARLMKSLVVVGWKRMVVVSWARGTLNL